MISINTFTWLTALQLFPADHQKEVQADYANRSDAEIIIRTLYLLDCFGASFLPVPDATHGFSCRGDLNNDKERKIKDDATEKAITFFQKHLA